MKHARSLMIIGIGGALAVLVAGRAYQPTKQKTAVNSTTAPPQFSGGLDYLNFDFNALFGGDNVSRHTEQIPLKSDPRPQTKGIRNNNPLNVEAGANWQGLTGSDGRFAIFETPFWGIRAAARTLKTYRDKHGLNTVQDIVSRWAPPTDENPTDSYIAFVANKSGVLASQPLSFVDYKNVIGAMIHFENGYNPYDEQTITSAAANGFA
jgi:hypothetical protein